VNATSWRHFDILSRQILLKVFLHEFSGHKRLCSATGFVPVFKRKDHQKSGWDSLNVNSS